MDNFDLYKYLSCGVENIIKEALKATLNNPKESAFIGSFSLAAKKAANIRRNYEKYGEHIPPFLIASITSKCNLHCSGCYARNNNSCHDGWEENQLSVSEWSRIFCEANDLGISFVLLAGGEPLVRRDVIEQAAKYKNIVFPVFTNGTMIDNDYANFFDSHRNLIPVLSIEGNEEKTDGRRGAGVYRKVYEAMDRFVDRKLLFGTSITVTTENVAEVISDEFICDLNQKGCKLMIYVEYVPVNSALGSLALSDTERKFISDRIKYLRVKNDKMLFISFPGDEKSSGGCLAAGRGFFHINSHGGAEPCPFSPYSDTNIKDIPLIKAIHSPLFSKLRSNTLLDDDHDGGCVLFGKEEDVKKLLIEA